jgi:hypothetical protein
LDAPRGQFGAQLLDFRGGLGGEVARLAEVFAEVVEFDGAGLEKFE